MTEAQGNHRRDLEKTHLTSQIAHQKRRDYEAKLGQFFAFLIAVLAICGSVYIAIHGYQWAAAFLSALGLSGIITPFIVGRKEKETKSTDPN